jgi:hypothetical protein
MHTEIRYKPEEKQKTNLKSVSVREDNIKMHLKEIGGCG